MLVACVWTVGAHAYLRTIERRATALVKAKRRKRNKTNETPEKDNTTSARRIQVRATCGLSNYGERTSTRVRLLWAILSLVLPVTFGHTTACRSPALAFPTAIHFAMKHSAVLRHSPSSWAAVAHWSALMPKALRSSKKHPVHSFSCPPHAARAPH